MFRVDRVDRDCLILPWIDVKAPPEAPAFIIVPSAGVKYVEMALGWFFKLFFFVSTPFDVVIDFLFRVVFICLELDGRFLRFSSSLSDSDWLDCWLSAVSVSSRYDSEIVVGWVSSTNVFWVVFRSFICFMEPNSVRTSAIKSSPDFVNHFTKSVAWSKLNGVV
ncbi:nonstructural protein [Bombyx mori densovirus 5]|uniref:Nonstructural protein n=1 Tax=Bombyx mori densovirus 5 (isolate Shinshu) TaxID=648251 RepID=Q9JFY1_BMDNS|nr:nonstructural protein [Bombyx mori densovirus 5]BAA96075.1 nonstructural protein [Bombyx mori densovirus 5]